MPDEPSDPAFDAGEIEKLFTKAKSSGESYPFAFGLASKPEECGFAVSIRKAGTVLKKELKSASKSIKKVCVGTFVMDGSDVRLSSEAPIKGIIKQLKKRLRDAGMTKYKPVLVGADGMEIDEDSLPENTLDEEDEPAVIEAPDAPAAPQRADDNRLIDLKARLLAIRPRLDGVPKEQSAALVAAFTKAVALLRGGDAGGTAAALDAIERVLDRLTESAGSGGSSVPPQPDPATRLTTALAALVPRIRAIAAGPEQQAVATHARAAQALIASGDNAGAAAAIKALSLELGKAERPQTTQDWIGSPLAIWNAAKDEADAGITALQNALRGFRHPDTDRVAEFGLAGLSGGGVQTAMITALMTYERAAPPDRSDASKALVRAISAYRNFLGGNRLLALCEANPFGIKLDIRGTLGTGLDRIERSLAA